jgi:hypothetical protein
MMSDYGIAKATEMDNFRDDVSEAWKHLLKSFSIGNSKWRCVLLRIEHYKNFCIKDGEDFEQYLGRVILATNQFKEANKGISLSDQELLAYLLVGIGKDIFHEISQDLGRVSEDQLTFESTIICIRNRLLMQKVNSTVSETHSDSHHYPQLELSGANLSARTSDNQRAKFRANKKRLNLRKKSLFKASNGKFSSESVPGHRNYNNNGHLSSEKRFRLSNGIQHNRYSIKY